MIKSPLMNRRIVHLASSFDILVFKYSSYTQDSTLFTTRYFRSLKYLLTCGVLNIRQVMTSSRTLRPGFVIFSHNLLYKQPKQMVDSKHWVDSQIRYNSGSKTYTTSPRGFLSLHKIWHPKLGIITEQLFFTQISHLYFCLSISASERSKRWLSFWIGRLWRVFESFDNSSSIKLYNFIVCVDSPN